MTVQKWASVHLANAIAVGSEVSEWFKDEKGYDIYYELPIWIHVVHRSSGAVGTTNVYNLKQRWDLLPDEEVATKATQKRLEAAYAAAQASSLKEIEQSRDKNANDTGAGTATRAVTGDDEAEATDKGGPRRRPLPRFNS